MDITAVRHDALDDLHAREHFLALAHVHLKLDGHHMVNLSVVHIDAASLLASHLDSYLTHHAPPAGYSPPQWQCPSAACRPGWRQTCGCGPRRWRRSGSSQP